MVKKRHLPKSKVFDPHHYVRSGADQKPSTLEDEEKGGRRVILGCAITYRKSKVARMLSEVKIDKTRVLICQSVFHNS